MTSLEAVVALVVEIALRVSAPALLALGIGSIAGRNNPARGAWIFGGGVGAMALVAVLTAVPWELLGRSAGVPVPQWTLRLPPPPFLDRTTNDLHSADELERKIVPFSSDVSRSSFPNTTNTVIPASSERRDSPTGDSEASRWVTNVLGGLTLGVVLGSVWSLVGIGLSGWRASGIAARGRLLIDPQDSSPDEADLSLQALAEALTDLSSRLRLANVPRIVESDHRATAWTTGWRKPIVALPPGWRTWTNSRLKATLAHELIHVKHGDAPIGLALMVATALMGHHPLAWLLVVAWRRDVERTADWWAARLVGDRTAYVRTLV